MRQGNRGRAEWECKWYYNGTTKSSKWLQNGFKMTACYQVTAQPTIGCLYSISIRRREKEGYIWTKTLHLLHRTQEESHEHKYRRRRPQLRQPVKSQTHNCQLWSNGLHVTKCSTLNVFFMENIILPMWLKLHSSCPWVCWVVHIYEHRRLAQTSAEKVQVMRELQNNISELRSDVILSGHMQ